MLPKTTKSHPYILKHTATGQCLTEWIDGWHLVPNNSEATAFQSAESARVARSTLEKLFGRIEVVPICSKPQVAAG